MPIQVYELITIGYALPTGDQAEFTIRLDRAANAPAPYEQVKAQIVAALNGAEDDSAFEALINDRYGSTASADRANVTPAQVNALLDRISARQGQIDQRRTAIAADLALLPTATAAQQRQIIGRLLNSEDDTLAAEKQELAALDKLIRAMRRLV